MMKPCGLRIWTNGIEGLCAVDTEALPFAVNFEGSDQGWIIIGTPSVDLIREANDGSERWRNTVT